MEFIYSFLFINIINNFLDNNMFYFRILIRFSYINYIFITQYLLYKFYNFKYYITNKPTKLERLYLIKNIVNRLQNINIVYVKIFQSLCLNKNILNNNEKDYLLNYTDNVPFKEEDIDYEIFERLYSNYDIDIDYTENIKSGIISVVFKGFYNNEKIVIKILKKNIKQKLEQVFNEIKLLTKIASYIPYIKELNLNKILIDNKEVLFNQTDFIKETQNIKIFYEKNKNNKEYIIPKVYDDITQNNQNVIVMQNITGLTYKDIENYDINIKNKFGKLLYKFGLISILYNSAIHCDIHAGNVFFYINNDNILPKYQVGFIDFGICSFPNKNNQNTYYIFFNDIQYKKDYTNLDKVLYGILEENDIYNNMDNKNIFINEVKNCIKYSEFTDMNFFYKLSKVLNNYNFKFSKEFSQICLSLQIVESLSLSLLIDSIHTQNEILEEFNNINKIIEI